MDGLFGGVDGVVVYQDNIYVRSASLEEHRRRLHVVLTKLSDAGFTVNAEKCTWLASELNVLGFKVSREGVHPREDKGKSHVLEPLHRLLDADSTWNWGPREQQALDAVKELISSDAVLVHYDLNKPVTVVCDASPHGVGAGDQPMYPEPAGVFLLEAKTPDILTAESIAVESGKDPVIRDVMTWVNEGWPSVVPPEAAPYFQKRNSLSIHRGCLLQSDRVVVPESLRAQVLELVHAAHPGIVASKAIARSIIWWPKWCTDVEDTVRRCTACQLEAKMPPKKPYRPWPAPERCWQRVHLDYAGPFLGHYFLIAIDAFSKWPVVKIMASLSSAALIAALRAIFADFGCPQVIVTDNGSSFIAADTKAFLDRNGVKLLHSPPWHPASNGLAERTVYAFKQAMARFRDGPIHARLARALWSMRSRPSSVTGNQVTVLNGARSCDVVLNDGAVRHNVHVDHLRPRHPEAGAAPVPDSVPAQQPVQRAPVVDEVPQPASTPTPAPAPRPPPATPPRREPSATPPTSSPAPQPPLVPPPRRAPEARLPSPRLFEDPDPGRRDCFCGNPNCPLADQLVDQLDEVQDGDLGDPAVEVDVDDLLQRAVGPPPALLSPASPEAPAAPRPDSGRGRGTTRSGRAVKAPERFGAGVP
ncbi:hypothetical protein ONE63_009495 [Megalurothrips usitatus]|uniref:RNA-directed DNA polymerase n=1 Tax=Megalurothrips usitatus TaxID=439358 RepID=A0AAV7XKR9_9NEOP|nr:hypothetical protein ONE63_009495 [Megalurothrips usitatus]